jgi:hypothetical protein
MKALAMRTRSRERPPRSPLRRRGRPSPRAVASSKGDDSIPARRIRRHQTLVLSDREAAGTDYLGGLEMAPHPPNARKRPGAAGPVLGHQIRSPTPSHYEVKFIRRRP